MENIIIPKSLQIVMDDVGWFNGNDDRKRGGSAREMLRGVKYQSFLFCD